MFTQTSRSTRRWHASLIVSFVLHCVIGYYLVRPPRPIYVTPSQLAFGHGGTSTELVYLAQHGSAAAQDSVTQPPPNQISLRPAAPRVRPKPAPKASPINAAASVTG